MERGIAETDVTVPFNEHDIRAKAANDAEDLEHARALMSHASTATTKRVYRRKPEVVAPLQANKKGLGHVSMTQALCYDPAVSATNPLSLTYSVAERGAD